MLKIGIVRNHVYGILGLSFSPGVENKQGKFLCQKFWNNISNPQETLPSIRLSDYDGLEICLADEVYSQETSLPLTHREVMKGMEENRWTIIRKEKKVDSACFCLVQSKLYEKSLNRTPQAIPLVTNEVDLSFVLREESIV